MQVLQVKREGRRERQRWNERHDLVRKGKEIIKMEEMTETIKIKDKKYKNATRERNVGETYGRRQRGDRRKRIGGGEPRQV